MNCSELVGSCNVTKKISKYYQRLGVWWAHKLYGTRPPSVAPQYQGPFHDWDKKY